MSAYTWFCTSCGGSFSGDGPAYDAFRRDHKCAGEPGDVSDAEPEPWRRVIRDNDYYAGDLELVWHEDGEATAHLIWKAFDGGGCTVHISGYLGELHRLRDALTELIDQTGTQPRPIPGPLVPGEGIVGMPTSSLSSFPMASMGMYSPPDPADPSRPSTTP